MKFGTFSTAASLLAVSVAVPAAYADPVLTDFVMVNADSNDDYETIPDGHIFYTDNWPHQHNIRVDYDTTNTKPGSVQFFVNDMATPVKTENVDPYALAGDTPADDGTGYYFVDSKHIKGPGTYTVKAVPFQLKNGGGTQYDAGAAQVTFTVIEGDEPIIAHVDTCFTDFEIASDVCCDFDNFVAELEEILANHPDCAGADLIEQVGYLMGMDGASEGEIRDAFEEICEDSLDIHFGFNQVMTNNDVFVTEFYNGGTFWNEGRQSFGYNGKPSDILAKKPGRQIRNWYNNYAQNQPMIWPSEITNFNPDIDVGELGNCEAQAAMCCWVQDRQEDDDGNCASPYDEECKDADPADNTDICYHDMSHSPESSRTAHGYSVFPKDDDAGEGAAHCHGFAWNVDDDCDNLGYLFRANNLFYVSMYDHLYVRGYVRNVPGAPMCACIEQMPTVSRSDCTQIDEVERTTTYIYNAQGNNEFVVESVVEVEFNACEAEAADNDLYSYYMQEIADNVPASAARVIEQKLVGPIDNDEPSNCDVVTMDFLEKKLNGVSDVA